METEVAVAMSSSRMSASLLSEASVDTCAPGAAKCDDDRDASLRRQASSSLSTLASTPTPPASSRDLHFDLEPQDSMRSRGRACVPAEKHVSFRVTPSVRYFKSSQSASFSSLADDDASHEDAACRALRHRRVARRFRQDAVTVVPLDSAAAPHGGRVLLTKVAENALHRVEAAIRESHDVDAAASQREKQRSSSLPSTWHGSRRRRRVPPRDAAGVSELTTSARLAPDQQQREVVVSARIACPWRELLHVLDSTTSDALDAALFACLSDHEMDASHFLEAVDTTVDALNGDDVETKDASHRWDAASLPRWGSPLLKKLGMFTPNSSSKPSLSSASKWLRSTVRSKGTASAPASSPSASASERLIVDYGRRTDSSAIASRVVQLLASHIGQDHAAVGDAVAGYVLQGDSSDTSVIVSLYISQRRRTKRGFAWSLDLTSDAVVEAATAVISCFWHAVVGRRLAFQALTYADFVYGLDIADAEQDETHCRGCSTAFGLFRRRHFCHLCSLWACYKCSTEESVETHRGWTQPLRVCVACVKRMGDCSFVDRHTTQTPTIVYPNAPIVVAEPSAHLPSKQLHLPHHLLQLWRDRAIDRTEKEDRDGAAMVLEALVLAFRQAPEDCLNDELDYFQVFTADDTEIAALEQQIVIDSLALQACRVNPDQELRQYELVFDNDTGLPQAPATLDEPLRVQRVKRLGLLDPSLSLSRHQALDCLCTLAAKQLGCAMAFVSIVGARDTRFIGRFGWQPSILPRDDGFCAYTLQSVYPLIHLDLARDIRGSQFTLHRVHGGRFYCGVPLLGPDRSFIMATFVVADTRPRAAMTTSTYAMISALAQVARLLLLPRDGPERRVYQAPVA
ncbi:hypothetical protein PINS_up005772 [Pythium insidiosum]|nr:hypothetical protein PINS_up005772 [Pythium insidiosum]